MSDGENSVVVGGGGMPRMLLTTERRLSPEQIERLRYAFEDAHKGRALVIALEQMKLYQLIDGRYVPLDTPPAGPGPLRRIAAALGAFFGKR